MEKAIDRATNMIERRNFERALITRRNNLELARDKAWRTDLDNVEQLSAELQSTIDQLKSIDDHRYDFLLGS